jgi:hypothetical protein
MVTQKTHSEKVRRKSNDDGLLRLMQRVALGALQEWGCITTYLDRRKSLKNLDITSLRFHFDMLAYHILMKTFYSLFTPKIC